MSDNGDTRTRICKRLRELGYEKEKHIRLYGKDLQLISNPVPDGDGFAIEGTTKTSGHVVRMRIPLSVISTLQKELAAEV